MNTGSSTNPEDQQIIDQIRKGGTERRRSEDQLFSRFSYFIREGITRHGLSEDDSFSAYSDSILSGIEKISNSTFEGRSSLKTYLFQIFHNKCVDLIRKKSTNKGGVHRTDSITEMLLYISDSAKTAVQKLMDKGDWNLLRQRLNSIGESCKQLLSLWADSYSDKEIAGMLEYKTADVVKTSRLRCMEKLRHLYKQT